MKISTRGRYAIRVMIDLAKNKDSGFISLKDVSERQEISMKYLEAIIQTLNKAGFVQSSRGKSGGYRLVKEPKDYKVGDIIRLTEGNLAPIACLECVPNTCPRRETCLTLPFWEGLNKAINDYVDSYTLEDLLNSRSDTNMFYI